MKRPLTDRDLKSLSKETSRKEVRDGTQPLWVRAGVRGLTFYTRHGGSRVRVGAYPDLGLAEARQTAMAVKAGLREKRTTPDTISRSPRKSLTTNECFAKFMEQEGKNIRDVDERLRRWGRDIAPHIGNKPIRDVTRVDLRVFLDAKKAKFPHAANAVYALVNRFFNWMVEEGWAFEELPENPMLHVSKPVKGLEGRTRFLSEREILMLLSAMPEAKSFAPAFEVILRTGRRKGEILQAKWGWLRDDHLHIPGAYTKNKKDSLLWLHPSVLKLIPARGNAKDSDRIFGVSPGGTSRPKKRVEVRMQQLAKDAGFTVPQWCLHDFRRTVQDYLERQQYPLEVRSAILSHTMQGVTKQYYSVHDYPEEKRKALTDWNGYIDDLLAQ